MDQTDELSVMVAKIIVGVLAVSAVIGWEAWRVSRSLERSLRDPKYARRRLLWLGAVYVVGAIVGVWQIATGELPKASLLGLIIVVCLAWSILRSAKNHNHPRA